MSDLGKLTSPTNKDILFVAENSALLGFYNITITTFLNLSTQNQILTSYTLFSANIFIDSIKTVEH